MIFTGGNQLVLSGLYDMENGGLLLGFVQRLAMRRGWRSVGFAG